MPNTSRRFAGPFPLPEETRPSGQTTLKNHVLIVVAINLAFADGIGRRDQSASVVVGVGNDVLLRHPFVRLIPLGPLNLIIHSHDATGRVTQKQRTPRTVIKPLNPPQKIPSNPQPVVVGITDRDQHTVAKVIKPRRLGQHQFVRRCAQIDRCFGQAVGDCRSSNSRQWKPNRAILMVRPHHRIARHRKPMRQRMTPAKPQPDIHFHRTGAI
ncbi:hypothetical protein [Pseudomonas sp. 8 R 14]|nr:hypothetical protein [Pseudomonas sp. 8 R 14]